MAKPKRVTPMETVGPGEISASPSPTHTNPPEPRSQENVAALKILLGPSCLKEGHNRGVLLGGLV